MFLQGFSCVMSHAVSVRLIFLRSRLPASALTLWLSDLFVLVAGTFSVSPQWLGVQTRAKQTVTFSCTTGCGNTWRARKLGGWSLKKKMFAVFRLYEAELMRLLVKNKKETKEKRWLFKGRSRRRRPQIPQLPKLRNIFGSSCRHHTSIQLTNSILLPVQTKVISFTVTNRSHQTRWTELAAIITK